MSNSSTQERPPKSLTKLHSRRSIRPLDTFQSQDMTDPETASYTIRSLTVGSKYLIRATFFYGNYDSKNKLPTFSVYIGLNYWLFKNESTPSNTEFIFEATADYLQVCLVRVVFSDGDDGGDPFISSLHLRRLKEGMYDPFVSSKQSLFSEWRYPDDKYDRWWTSYQDEAAWTEISTNSPVAPDPVFETPSLVMQTAATPLTSKQPLIMEWTTNVNHYDDSHRVILHFAEIQDNASKTDRREFNIFAGGFLSSNQPYTPPVLSSQTIYFNYTWINNYNITLEATSNSILPPLQNAIELYRITPVPAPTYAEDVIAINRIKDDHSIITLGWIGDPCSPYQWPKIACDNYSDITRITKMDLSNNHLSGPLPEFLGRDLPNLQYLNLADNSFSGSLPGSLDSKNLTTLDITGTNLSTILPPNLLKKKQNGTLIFRYDDSDTNPSGKMDAMSMIAIAVVVVVFLLIVIAVGTIIFSPLSSAGVDDRWSEMTFVEEFEENKKRKGQARQKLETEAEAERERHIRMQEEAFFVLHNAS
ncbi:Leucine-rich repeat protein kinase family protein [Rhynchospora pubera]|uniref:Leucine-rich repeat protein kinase family protein n=1 Tax=Rhynchospora pubera TaxID=906938 RepID=A0AAV8EYQ2_9POAL|nr:Leucine-rich repeat protein kinase family protein [Rhynchospora pubera]